MKIETKNIYKSKKLRKVKLKYLDGWHAAGFFVPEGFLILVPGVKPSGIFEEEMLGAKTNAKD